jgi:competence protein ComEC
LRRAAPVAAVAALALALAAGGAGDELGGPPPSGLRVSVLDVGQGDAILLQPIRAEPVLVDTGPPGSDVLEELERAGVSRLGAVILTHDQSDHAGGLGDVVSTIPVGEVLHAGLEGETAAAVDDAGVARRRIHAGLGLRSGRLRLEVLWPPPERPTDPADPNLASVVLLARWRHFTMLLCGDAEAESVPIDPGPLDVLKVAHHGSADAGLEVLLERTDPGLAVISAGEGNPFGHPTPVTLSTLAAHGTTILRTDRDGTITIAAGRGAATATTVD